MLILQGFLCGIGFIIPGVSFSTIAMMLNIYDLILNSINNLFKNFKKSIKILFPFCVGAILSCLILFYPISILIKYFPLSLYLIFVGLMCGGFSTLLSKVKNKDLSLIIISFLIFFFLNSYSANFIKISLFEVNYFNLIFILLLSLCCAFSSLAPSLSITFILITFNVYEELLLILSDFSLINLNVILNITVLGISFIFFAFTFSKIIKKLLDNHYSKTMAIFIGASISTLINIFTNKSINIIPFNKTINLWYYYFISVSLMLLSYFIIYRLNLKQRAK